MVEASTDLVAMAGGIVAFARALNARLRELSGGTGPTLAELNVLAGIEKGHDLSSALVRVLMLDAPRVSRIVESFVESGVIIREPDPDDRRRQRLRLTPAGRECLQRGRANLASAVSDLLSELTEEERVALEIAAPGMRRVATRGASVEASS